MKLWKVRKWVESRFLSQVINKLHPVLRDFWSCTKVALLLHLSVQGLALFSTDTGTPQLVVPKYDLTIQHFQDLLWISIHIYSCLLYGKKLKKTLSFWEWTGVLLMPEQTSSSWSSVLETPSQTPPQTDFSQFKISECTNSPSSYQRPPTYLKMKKYI